MALLTVPRARGRHAAKTPLWRQIGIGHARHNLTEARLVSAPRPEPAVAKVAAPTLVVSAEQAREVVERLFPTGTPGLYPLDWRYGTGYATAQVDPGLIPEAARNVVLAYASALDAPFVQDETGEGRLHMRVSRSVDGVQVTVWTVITPEPQLALLAAAPVADPELPIEREVRCVLDETQAFAPITDDMDDPREHQDADPDGDQPEPVIAPDHTPPADAAHADLTNEPAEGQVEAQPADEEPSEAPEDVTADRCDEEAA